MPKGLKKVLKIIIDVLTLIVFLILVVIIFAKVKMMTSNKDYFDVFGYSVFTIASGSMEPTLSINDIIIVKKNDNYSVNDIVTYRDEKDDAYVTHRIVSKNGNRVITKGDHNNTNDAIIDESVIIGKLVKTYRKAGIWQKVITTPYIIAMIFVTLILFDFAFSYKGIKKKQNIKIVEQIKEKPLVEVNKIDDSPKMTNEEIKELVKKTDLVKKGEEVTFDKKEKEFLNYTIRLDLEELQKQINGKMNGE